MYGTNPNPAYRAFGAVHITDTEPAASVDEHWYGKAWKYHVRCADKGQTHEVARNASHELARLYARHGKLDEHWCRYDP
jgi:hypothetical protein